MLLVLSTMWANGALSPGRVAPPVRHFINLSSMQTVPKRFPSLRLPAYLPSTSPSAACRALIAKPRTLRAS